jgi:hypothetical protein
MSKREVAGLAIKLMGVWILITVLVYLPISIGGVIGIEHRGGTGLWMALWYLLPSIVSLGWGVLIALFSEKIAGWLIKEDKAMGSVGAIQTRDVLTVGFTIMGLFLIVTDIPDLIFRVAQYFQMRNNYENMGRPGVSETIHMFGPVIQIALGVWLFAGSRGIVKLWERIRA